MADRRSTRTTFGRACLALWCLAAGLAAPARAQPTNLEVYQELALRCLADVPDTARVVHLEAPPQMPYLRTALVARWQQQGRVLFLADSSFQAAGGAHRLRYAVEQAQVVYARARRKQFARTVSLALRFTLLAPDGRLLREDRCQDRFTDAIPRKDRAALESEAFPETQAEPPRGSWRRRYLEPAILAAATAVTIYLFFNLRSERTNDEF